MLSEETCSGTAPSEWDELGRVELWHHCSRRIDHGGRCRCKPCGVDFTAAW